MSKKAFIIFIIFILIILCVFGWYVFVRENTLPGDAGGDETSDLFPFGQRPVDTTGDQGGLTTTPGDLGDTGSSTVDLGGLEGELPRLRQISMVPTAGAAAFNVGSTTLVRYIERATGHIYEAEGARPITIKISNTTIPKIHEALWSGNGGELLIRYLKDDSPKIRTFYARIATTTRPEQAIEGIFLADDIREISVSGNKAFYMSETNSGSQGIIANMDGSGRTSVFNSSFSDWRSSLSSPTQAIVFSRPSGAAEGSAYILNTSNGSYAKAGGDLFGLVALGNSDSSRVLLSATISRDLTIMSFDPKTGSSEPLGVRTIADKCAWSAKNKNIVYCAVPQLLPNGVYPDDWYKGKMSFNDGLWRIDVGSGETENLFDPELEVGISMDMFKLDLDQEENVIIFTNKKDMTVWLYRLNQ